MQRAARRAWRRARRWPEKETSDWERRGVYGGGHVVGKRKKRVIESSAAGTSSTRERNE
jgi:hypothetical protein